MSVRHEPINKFLHKVFKDTEEEFGLSREQVKDIYFSHWETVRKYLGNVQLPTVTVHGLGTFKPKVYAVARDIEGVRSFEVKRAYYKYKYALYRLLIARLKKYQKNLPYTQPYIDKVNDFLKRGVIIPLDEDKTKWQNEILRK